MATNLFAPDGNGVMGAAGAEKANAPDENAGISNQSPALISGQTQFTDAQLLDKWKRAKKESFDQRWIFERQWMRNVWYILNRQWIYFDVKRGQWQDRRLAKWIPRPVTNILKDGLDTIRSSFANINYGATGRPIGDDHSSIVTAGVVDDYGPILHDTHKMDEVLDTGDFWLLGCGNAFLHTGMDYSYTNGQIQIQHASCLRCGTTVPENEIADAGQKCPSCAGSDFMPALDDAGNSITSSQTKSVPKTWALSPFETAFPIMYDSFDESPYVIVMRWRDRSFYEQDQEMVDKGYDKSLSFGKTPQERTMQIFKTLPFQSDLGIAPPYFASGGANADTEGLVEYDWWIKPCKDFPEGQVIRIASDGNPTIIHSDQEGLPGPLPYQDAKGNPIFPFWHMRYSRVGGRVYGSALIDPAIQKQDQINQVDSHFLMCLGRMANPIWLEPKGAEVEKFTGEPGLVVKWNPLIGNGTAEPKRIPGEGLNETWFQYRDMLKGEAEELMGTNDVLKGQKPAGVDAYSAMELLLQQGQAKHSSAYKSRGRAYKGWFKAALELERAYGPAERLRAIQAPSKGWSFKIFQQADLSGSVDIMIEDGTLAPKTALGERAAIDHLASMQMINPQDPDQKMAIYQAYGLTKLTPALDAQVEEAWYNMDRFEKFFDNPQAIQAAQAASQAAQQMAAITGQPAEPVGPLMYKKWYNPQIHRNELIKWLLSDRGRTTLAQHPQAEGFVTSYLAQIDIAIAQDASGMLDAGGVMLPTQPPPGGMHPPGAGAPAGGPQQQGMHGAAQAHPNSTQNAGGVGPRSSGPGSDQNRPNQQ